MRLKGIHIHFKQGGTTVLTPVYYGKLGRSVKDHLNKVVVGRDNDPAEFLPTLIERVRSGGQ